MLVARCYAVLDRLVAEVSCVHIGDQEESHLVFREESDSADGSLQDGLRHLATALDLAAWDVARRRGLGELEPGSSCRP